MISDRVKGQETPPLNTSTCVYLYMACAVTRPARPVSQGLNALPQVTSAANKWKEVSHYSCLFSSSFITFI